MYSLGVIQSVTSDLHQMNTVNNISVFIQYTTEFTVAPVYGDEWKNSLMA
jgi:hypothetical protein